VPKTQRQFKDEIYGQIARINEAATASKRLELPDLGPRTVELRAARLVAAQKQGLYVDYRLADGEVANFFVARHTLAQPRLAEVVRITRDYLDRRSALEAVEGDALRSKGFRAHRMEQGVADWRARGFRVATAKLAKGPTSRRRTGARV
jgi:aryl carrier-like protein